MAKPVRFSPKKAKDGSGWRINIPAKFSQTGKRQQFFYRTQALALAAAEDLKTKRENFGNQTRAITPSLAEQATAAASLLEPLGIGLLEAVRRFVDTENRARASETVKCATDAFQLAKEGLSHSQATAYRLRCEKLVDEFGDRMISTLDGEELQDHLEKTTSGPAAFNQNYRLIRAIWKWCAKPPRKWCDEEPIRHLETKDAGSGEIGVLLYDQAVALMREAEKSYPEAVPAMAIELFTGIRAAELCRLESKHITAEGINIPASHDRKNKRRRFIQMPEPLKAWLEAYPIVDNVIPPDWSRKRRAIRRLAGFRVWSDLVEPSSPPASLPEWPANALRHTAATVSVALGKPIELLVFEHGHTGGLEMLRRQYVGAMPKKEALAIWNIMPNGVKEIPTIKTVS